MQKFIAIWITFFSIVSSNVAQYDEFNCILCPPQAPITQANIAQVRHYVLSEGATLNFDFAPHQIDGSYYIFYMSTPDPIAELFDSVQALFVRKFEPNPDDRIFDMTGLRTDDGFTSVAYSPNVTIAASGNEQGQITFWDIEQQESLQGSDEIGMPVTDMVFHPEENWLAAIHENVQIGIYTQGDENVQWLLLAEEDVTISNAVFSADGQLLLAGVGTILQVWNSIDLTPLMSTSIDGDVVYWVLAHPQKSETFYTLSNTSVSEWMWDADARNLEPITSFNNPFSADSVVTSATMNHDGSVIILVLDEQRLVVWDTLEGQIIEVPSLEHIISNSVRPTYDVAFSPDGMFLAIGTGFGISFFVIA